MNASTMHIRLGASVLALAGLWCQDMLVRWLRRWLAEVVTAAHARRSCGIIRLVLLRRLRSDALTKGDRLIISSDKCHAQ